MFAVPASEGVDGSSEDLHMFVGAATVQLVHSHYLRSAAVRVTRLPVHVLLERGRRRVDLDTTTTRHDDDDNTT